MPLRKTAKPNANLARKVDITSMPLTKKHHANDMAAIENVARNCVETWAHAETDNGRSPATDKWNERMILVALINAVNRGYNMAQKEMGMEYVAK
jgi:hypothetical protein